MKLDTANRSFFMLVALALGPFLLLGVLACGALSLAVYELLAGGPQAVAGAPGGWLAFLFLAVAGAGSIAAVWSLHVQHTATRRLAALVRSSQVPVPDSLQDAAAHAGLRAVDVVDSEVPYALTYRALSPRVVVSKGLLAVTTRGELEAVLAHERYHVANLDPLKAVVARGLAAALFFLPALRHLHQRYVTGRELAADARAVRKAGASPLASALYKVASGPTPPRLGAAAAIGGHELLDFRVAQLEAGHEPVLPTVPRRAAILTVLGFAVMAGGAAVTVAVASGVDLAGARTPPDLAGGLVCGALWLAAGIGAYHRFAARP